MTELCFTEEFPYILDPRYPSRSLSYITMLNDVDARTACLRVVDVARAITLYNSFQSHALCPDGANIVSSHGASNSVKGDTLTEAGCPWNATHLKNGAARRLHGSLDSRLSWSYFPLLQRAIPSVSENIDKR